MSITTISEQMSTDAQTTDRPRTRATNAETPISNKQRWAGRAVSGLPVLFLTFDGVVKLFNPSFVREGSAGLGFPPDLAPTLGVVLLASVALYVIRRTSVFGAVMLTGYLGGAISCHARVEDPLFSHVLFPVYVAVMLWGGLFLRDERVRALNPFRAQTSQ